MSADVSKKQQGCPFSPSSLSRIALLRDSRRTFGNFATHRHFSVAGQFLQNCTNSISDAVQTLSPPNCTKRRKGKKRKIGKKKEKEEKWGERDKPPPPPLKVSALVLEERLLSRVTLQRFFENGCLKELDALGLRRKFSKVSILIHLLILWYSY